MYLSSTPLVTEWLIWPLEETYPALNLSDLGANRVEQAIVVLSAGHNYAPEYNGQTVSPDTLVRLRYAATLARHTHLPLLVSGDERMQKVLEQEYLMPVRWNEQRSQDTWQNAQYSAEILQHHHIHSIFLVTNAWHMRRAVLAFERAGLKVTPAPTGYVRFPASLYFYRLLPIQEALDLTQKALNEYFGYWWYCLA